MFSTNDPRVRPSSPRRVHAHARALGRTKRYHKEETDTPRPSLTHDAPDVTATHTDDNSEHGTERQGNTTHTRRHTHKKNPNRKPGARTKRCVSPFPKRNPSMKTLDRIARHRSTRRMRERKKKAIHARARDPRRRRVMIREWNRNKIVSDSLLIPDPN